MKRVMMRYGHYKRSLYGNAVFEVLIEAHGCYLLRNVTTNEILTTTTEGWEEVSQWQ